MIKKGKGKNKEGILTSEMFRGEPEPAEIPKQPQYDPAEYDELYPDYVREKLHKEVSEIIEETRRKMPVSDDIKMDVYNRLVGIQNISNEWKAGKYAKIIMLAQECIDMLEIDKVEEKKDE